MSAGEHGPPAGTGRGGHLQQPPTQQLSRSQRQLVLSQTLVRHHLAPLREQSRVITTPRAAANVDVTCCEALAGPVELPATLAAPTL